MAKIEVKLVRSTIGCSEYQRNAVRALGLRKIGGSRTLEDSPAIRGLIKSVVHLLSVNFLED